MYVIYLFENNLECRVYMFYNVVIENVFIYTLMKLI